MILFYSLTSTDNRCHKMNNLWEYLSIIQQHLLTTSLWVKQFEVRSCWFPPFEEVQAGTHVEKGTGMLCRARTWFLFSRCYLVKVSNKNQFHTTGRLAVNSVTSTESSNYNFKIKPSHIPSSCGSVQSLLHIHLIRRKSLDEVTWINTNIKTQYINPFYF